MNLKEIFLIGRGGFRAVYKGVLDHGRTIVAVKLFNLANCGASKSFMAECRALRTEHQTSESCQSDNSLFKC